MLVEAKSGVSTSSPSYAAFRILHLGFIALPVLAGLDKFFHILARSSTSNRPAEIPAFA
jgi:hypothetical protein